MQMPEQLKARAMSNRLTVKTPEAFCKAAEALCKAAEALCKAAEALCKAAEAPGGSG